MYKVIDNFLEKEDFEKIKSTMFGEHFPWFFQSNVATATDHSDEYYFTHMFYWNYRISSSFFDALTPLINKINPSAIIRVKGNMYPNLNRNIINRLHTDLDFSHKGAVYYLNTNNGKTILKNGEEIDSIENRILFFDSSLPHQSTHCTDEKVRMNINLNYF
jgi:hypothetical protein